MFYIILQNSNYSHQNPNLFRINVDNQIIHVLDRCKKLRMFLNVLHILLIFLLFRNIDGSCSPCRCTTRVINCNNINFLTSIDIPCRSLSFRARATITYIFARQTNISHLTNENGCKLPNLVYIDLRGVCPNPIIVGFKNVDVITNCTVNIKI